MPEYSCTGPVPCDTDFDTSRLKGKTAVVTGGANGIGEGYVRALVGAGALVCIGDLDVKGGTKLAEELSGVKFVKCDVTSWDDQVQLFKDAETLSSDGKISYVIPNAGMIKADTVFGSSAPGPDSEPVKPDLQILQVNIVGSMYTIRLALHYFQKQNGIVPSSDQEDTCLVLIGSGASFLDGPRGPQYAATKWAMRGVLHSLRRTAYYHGSRVNMIAPWYVKTKIMAPEVFDHVESCGVVIAKIEHAQQCLLRILSDTTMNGRSLFVSGEKWSPQGYMDLDIDDYHGNALLEDMTEDQMKGSPVSAGLFA